VFTPTTGQRNVALSEFSCQRTGFACVGTSFVCCQLLFKLQHNCNRTPNTENAFHRFSIGEDTLHQLIT